MKVFRATNTLKGYLQTLDYTLEKSEAEIILVGGKAFSLEEFPNLKGVFKTGVGLDNLPLEEAEQLGIVIGFPSEETRDVIFEETASYTCNLLLRGLYAEVGEWDSWVKYDRMALSKRRLLVVGAGRIGRRVAEKMRVFMEVDTFDIAHDELDSFESKVRLADCVSLHVPLNDDTTGLFGPEELSWMQDGSLLVNTSRGPVIEESALFEELSSGRLRAAIDVFWHEPYRGKLIGLPSDRLIKTPHVASTCAEFLSGTASDFLVFIEKLSLEKRVDK